MEGWITHTGHLTDVYAPNTANLYYSHTSFVRWYHRSGLKKKRVTKSCEALYETAFKLGWVRITDDGRLIEFSRNIHPKAKIALAAYIKSRAGYGCQIYIEDEMIYNEVNSKPKTAIGKINRELENIHDQILEKVQRKERSR